MAGKPIYRSNTARKAKARGEKTKWELKRERQREYRTADRSQMTPPKKPLVEPLKIASKKERHEAFKRGKTVFYDGSKKIELPLFLYGKAEYGHTLQGAYKTADGRIVTLRHKKYQVYGRILLHKVIRGKEIEIGFVHTGQELAHMRMDKPWRLMGIALKATAKADRHARATEKANFKRIRVWQKETKNFQIYLEN